MRRKAYRDPTGAFFRSRRWQITSGELSVGMETKQEVKIGYHYDRFIFRINGRLQSLQWNSKSETICLGMPEHSIYLFLVSYLRKWLLLKCWATSWGINLVHCTMKTYSKIGLIIYKTHTRMHEYMTAYIYTSMTPVYSGLMRSHQYVWDDTIMTQTRLTASKNVNISQIMGVYYNGSFLWACAAAKLKWYQHHWL